VSGVILKLITLTCFDKFKYFFAGGGDEVGDFLKLCQCWSIIWGEGETDDCRKFY